jgi:nucleotide-binding universal stress UspA family protein
MAYRRIVLATDGSASAETPERVAAGLATATGGTVTIAHAPTRPSPARRASWSAQA